MSADRRCGHRRYSNAPLQCLPFEQLHGHERLALVLIDLVNGADIGVIGRRRSTSLALKTLERLAIVI